MYAGHAAAASAAGADGIVFYPSSAAMAARGDAGVSPAGGGRWLPQPECFDEEDCGLDPGDVAATVVPGDFADAVLRALGEVARAVNSSRPMSRPMTLKGVWFQIVEMMMNLKRTQTLPFKCNKMCHYIWALGRRKRKQKSHPRRRRRRRRRRHLPPRAAS